MTLTKAQSDISRRRDVFSADLVQGARADRIRQLNDRLRCQGDGGRVMITAGVAALPAAVQASIFAAIRSFAAFDGANDPFDEHDFGVVRTDATCACWKIDYYDRTLTAYSPDPAIPAVTIRVLTIMLGAEF
ncbi:DUF3768 domain-containing protein [Lichenifustis flavocetrariae]|uniref:DUF3768 domain-containing protein n=1 Tax=Lichenifustis flavocetrariae TaxID=2949735 RepID=A0AA41Z0H8_9HYPH|nr:DUF3768 domain-containing protein [Lichenifustis flavocetrariae]MCW6511954.1 DUF3768 domain-containing protein [Lichenifustis flavocetrariae]